MKREDLETLSAIRQITGIQVRIGQHDEIKSYQVTDEGSVILLAVTVYDVQDTVRETRFRKCGWKIYTLKKIGESETRIGGWWRIVDTSDIYWDSDFEPYVFQNWSRYESQAEIKAREEWEDMCHRPGTSRFPMDNADRRFQKEVTGL